MGGKKFKGLVTRHRFIETKHPPVKARKKGKENGTSDSLNKWNLHGGKTTMLYLNLSGHDIFKKRFGTSPEKHCLTAMPYRLFSRKLTKLT